MTDKSRQLLIEKLVNETIEGLGTASIMAHELKKCLTALEEAGIVLTDGERLAAIDRHLAPASVIITAGEAMEFDRRGLWQKLADERLPWYAYANADEPEEAAGLTAMIEVSLRKKVDFDREVTKGYVVNAIVVWLDGVDPKQHVALMDERLATYGWNRDKLRAALKKHPSPLLSKVLTEANGSKK